MSYVRATVIDPNPGGSTRKQAILDLDTDTTGIFANLNTHEALTTGMHGITAGDGSIVGTAKTQTLTNKTLTSPVFNTGVSGTAIDTDGTLAANSDTKLASQKATKTYADTKQTSHANLTALVGLTGAANKLIRFTDAGAMEVISQNTITPVRDTFRNLVINNNSSHGDHQLDITADEIILQDSSGNCLRITSFTKTVDLAASGANGLDTGSEASSAWYYIWAIAKADGTHASLLSASSTAPTLPSGYTYKALIGADYNDGSGNLIVISQLDRKVVRASLTVLNAGTQTSATSISLATAVPPTAKRVTGRLKSYYVSASNAVYVYNYVASTALGTVSAGHATAAIDQYATFLLLNLSQAIYYHCGNAGNTASVYVEGWEF